VGRGTVANVLKANGIEPAPERLKHTRWSTFLKAHWKVFAASDFFSIEVLTGRGLVTHYVLFVISLVDRIVHIAGITTQPDEAWMLQVARAAGLPGRAIVPKPHGPRALPARFHQPRHPCATGAKRSSSYLPARSRKAKRQGQRRFY
jgi:hypothetical protein